MEENNSQFPDSNAIYADDDYRPHPTPLYLQKNLQFLEISDDGHMMVGCADLSGRFWSSAIWYSKETKTEIERGSTSVGIERDSIMCSGKIIESGKKVVVGDDAGGVYILSIHEKDSDELCMVIDVKANDHDSSVLSLSLSPDRKSLVTGGMDMCIKVWDISESLSTLFTYRPAHSHMVTHVEYSPKSDHVFVSCSLDGSAVLWDTRETTKPALALKTDCDEGLQSGCWLENNDNVLAVGSNFGNIMLIDTRMINVFGHAECFNRPLHRIVSNSEGILAACGDTHEVKAFQMSSDCLRPIYTSHSHDDFVRGLAWHPKTLQLYSCGFDSKIICHDIDKNQETV